MRASCVALLLLTAACRSGPQTFVKRDALKGVRKVALVQFAINPHTFLGSAADDRAKSDGAANAWEIFSRETAGVFEAVPFAAIAGNAAYQSAGRPAFDGYYSAKNARFFSSDEDAVEAALIMPQVARDLCAALRVDAVAVIHESWDLDFSFDYGHSQAHNTYSVSIYDATGARLVALTEGGISRTQFPIAPAAISMTVIAEVPVYVKANGEAFAQAMQSVKKALR